MKEQTKHLIRRRDGQDSVYMGRHTFNPCERIHRVPCSDHGVALILLFSTVQFHNTELSNDKELGTSPWQQAPMVQRWAGGMKRGSAVLSRRLELPRFTDSAGEKQTNSTIMADTGSRGRGFGLYGEQCQDSTSHHVFPK